MGRTGQDGGRGRNGPKPTLLGPLSPSFAPASTPGRFSRCGTVLARFPAEPAPPAPQTLISPARKTDPMNYLLAPLLSLGLLAADAAAQRSQGTSPLRRARGTFAAADSNKDGVLDAREVSRASIPRDEFKAFDQDGDRALSSDEFLLYYRQLLIDARRPAGAELDREAARIQALRKAHEEKEARARRAAAKASGGGEGAGQGKPTDGNSASSNLEKLQRAKQALNERAVEGGMSREQLQAIEQGLEERARAASGSGSTPVDSVAPAGPAPTRQERLRAAHEAAEARRRHAAQRAREARQGAAGGAVTRMEDLTPSTRAKVQRALAALEVRAQAGHMTRAQFEAKKRELLERARQVDAAAAAGTDPGSSGQTAAQRAQAERRRRAAANGGGQTPAQRAQAERRRRAAANGGANGGGQTPGQRAQAERRRQAASGSGNQGGGDARPAGGSAKSRAGERRGG